MLSVDIAGTMGVREISVRFGADRGVTALVGPSGTGKSSVLRAIAGLWRPKRGTIKLGEKTLLDTQRWVDIAPNLRGVGAVFQQALLFPHLTVERNLLYGAKGNRDDFDTVIDMLDLGALLKRVPRNLSGGEAQRVSLGRALLSRPDVLLLDEPMTGLDEGRRMTILPYLQSMRASLTVPIVYVTHRSDEVAALATSVVRMENGQGLPATSVADYLKFDQATVSQ
ncbi:MAG: ATP-binding cassette domain-containing protein [Ahrensia sp.]|nr:ATP-binding cassette domain-containing protein [Ahrensia sp.]